MYIQLSITVSIVQGQARHGEDKSRQLSFSNSFGVTAWSFGGLGSNSFCVTSLVGLFRPNLLGRPFFDHIPLDDIYLMLFWPSCSDIPELFCTLCSDMSDINLYMFRYTWCYFEHNVQIYRNCFAPLLSVANDCLCDKMMNYTRIKWKVFVILVMFSSMFVMIDYLKYYLSVNLILKNLFDWWRMKVIVKFS